MTNTAIIPLVSFLAAGAGYIDGVIDPRDTRFTLIQALEVALGQDY